MGGKRLWFAGMLAAALAGGARAQDWNHNANIGSAVEALVAVHRAGGIDAAVIFIGDCYRTVDGFDQADEQLQRLEYCAGMDFAGFLVVRASAAGAADGSPAFFAAQPMFQRMQRLDRWVRDPATNHRILRAWAASAADSLRALQSE